MIQQSANLSSALRRGLTLIEVMAVVMLLGLLAAATAWSLAEDVRRTTGENVIAQIAHADHLARLAAMQFGQSTTLRFDLDTHTIHRIDTTQSTRTHTLNIPPPHRIERMFIQTANDKTPETTLSRRESGIIEIPYSPDGRSTTYAINLTSLDESKWMLIAGLTGRLTELTDEHQVNNLFTYLTETTGRPVTH